MNSIIFEYQYIVEDYITFKVRVVSGEFSGTSNFCILESSLRTAIASLSEMYNTLKGFCRMNDFDSDDFISFKMNSLGHMTITGQLGGSYNIPFLKYENHADQTILLDIISNFKSMVE